MFEIVRVYVYKPTYKYVCAILEKQTNRHHHHQPRLLLLLLTEANSSRMKIFMNYAKISAHCSKKYNKDNSKRKEDSPKSVSSLSCPIDSASHKTAVWFRICPGGLGCCFLYHPPHHHILPSSDVQSSTYGRRYTFCPPASPERGTPLASTFAYYLPPS